MRKKDMDMTREPSLRDLQEKKGFLRFMELMDRDGTKFLKAGALVFLTLIPFVMVIVAALVTGNPLLVMLCIPAGMIAAPEIAGAADTVMRSLRDEVGWWWWDTYKTAWKRNAKASLLPGAVFGLGAGVELYFLYFIAGLENPITDFWLLMGAALIEFAVLGYYLPMLACIDLPFTALVRNCFVLFLSHPIKSLVSALVQLIYYLMILVWFPLTSVIFLLTSVWLPMLISYMILYPVLDKHFGLKQAYEEIRKRQWEE